MTSSSRVRLEVFYHEIWVWSNVSLRQRYPPSIKSQRASRTLSSIRLITSSLYFPVRTRGMCHQDPLAHTVSFSVSKLNYQGSLYGFSPRSDRLQAIISARVSRSVRYNLRGLFNYGLSDPWTFCHSKFTLYLALLTCSNDLYSFCV